MRARTVMGVALAAALMAVAGCGGGSSSSDTTGSATTTGGDAGGASTSDALRIGTVNYIDSLNPFNYVEAQSTNAMIMIYPQLVQYGPGMKFEGDWASSWETSADGKDWTFHLQAGHEMVGREAADCGRCRLDDQHDRQVRGRPRGRRSCSPRPRQERRGDRPDDARDPLRVAGRERAGPARDVLRPAQARVGRPRWAPTARD